MIRLNNSEEVFKGYSSWLELNKKPFWAMATQEKAFIETHVPSSVGLKLVNNQYGMDQYLVPVSTSYPQAKLGAGVVLTRNTWEVLTRGLDPKLGEFIVNYLKDLPVFKLGNIKVERGYKMDSNDIYINGKKVFGELCFKRAGITYYACMINTYLDNWDSLVIQTGLSGDKNFYPSKMERISGLLNEIPQLDLDKMLETIEEYLFKLSDYTPEYVKN